MNKAIFRFSDKEGVERAYDGVSVMGVRETNGPFFKLGASEQIIEVSWHDTKKGNKDADKAMKRLVSEFGGVQIDKDLTSKSA